MSLRRAAAAAVLTTAVAASGLVAPTGTAHAASAGSSVSERASKGCVTKAEYRKIKNGMTVAKVKRITGTNGQQVSSSPLPGGRVVVGRGYKACTKNGGVGIAFVGQKGKPGTLKVASKSAQWG